MYKNRINSFFKYSQVLLINIYNDQLIVLTADCHITVYNLKEPQNNIGKKAF